MKQVKGQPTACFSTLCRCGVVTLHHCVIQLRSSRPDGPEAAAQNKQQDVLLFRAVL